MSLCSFVQKITCVGKTRSGWHVACRTEYHIRINNTCALIAGKQTRCGPSLVQGLWRGRSIQELSGSTVVTIQTTLPCFQPQTPFYVNYCIMSWQDCELCKKPLTFGDGSWEHDGIHHIKCWDLWAERREAGTCTRCGKKPTSRK